MGTIIFWSLIGLAVLLFTALIDGSIDGLLGNIIKNRFVRFLVRTCISSIILATIICFIFNTKFLIAIIYGIMAVLSMHIAILTGGKR